MFPVPEIWKDVKDFEGYYQVSNLGRIKSLKRTIVRRDGFHQRLKERILKKFLNPKGYHLVDLRKSFLRDTRTVHRLVTVAFLGESDLQVNHVNGVKIDNVLENLEYVSNRENCNHKSTILKNKKRFGVCFHKQRNKWKAEIGFNGKHKHIGLFVDKEDAYEAYYQKYLEVHGNVPWNKEEL